MFLDVERSVHRCLDDYPLMPKTLRVTKAILEKAVHKLECRSQCLTYVKALETACDAIVNDLRNFKPCSRYDVEWLLRDLMMTALAAKSHSILHTTIISNV